MINAGNPSGTHVPARHAEIAQQQGIKVTPEHSDAAVATAHAEAATKCAANPITGDMPACVMNGANC